jgi:hypothetical protein
MATRDELCCRTRRTRRHSALPQVAHNVAVILEHALLPVKPGEEVAFETAFARAKPIIAGMPGFQRLALSRCIERPSTYLLLVEWRHLQDHTEESGKNRGRLCGQRLVIGGVGEFGVPAPVVVGEGVVEGSGADLQEQVCSSGAPPHLLLFDQIY